MTNPLLNASLVEAISERSITSVRKALDAGADPNGFAYECEASMLTLALKKGGSHAMCLLLLERGAKVIPADDSTEDPLATAACHGKVALCKELLSRGADINRRTLARESALSSAVNFNQVAMCRYLIDNGADVLAANNRGLIPLHFVDASLGNVEAVTLEIAELLIAHGSSPSYAPASPPKGYLTPFQMALAGNNVAVADYFIRQCGEDPRQLTLDGKSMIELPSKESARSFIRSALTEREVAASIDDGSKPPVSAKAVTRSPGPL